MYSPLLRLQANHENFLRTGTFSQKMTKPPKKFCNGNKFQSRDFRFKLRFKTDEKEKTFFFRIQCPVYRNYLRQILYNFGFFVRKLQIFSIFDELSTEMKNLSTLSYHGVITIQDFCSPCCCCCGSITIYRVRCADKNLFSTNKIKKTLPVTYNVNNHSAPF